ncbi:hypothetical protein EII17_10580 [Clostridiales bacterium COT073_COT-073]|nr:hypothetical protein EII17_10580 [Clostridiales bacterium COT073_COT-073]
MNQKSMMSNRRKPLVLFLTLCLLLSGFNGLKVNADTWPARDESEIKSAQPHFSGYRVRDIELWNPQTDHHAELMVAKVPLQKRNAAFHPTQANPKLTAPVQVMLMQSDYGNSFFDSTIANNDYGNLAFPFWQYTDYFSPWHGAATIGTPKGLYDPATSDWRKRGFEFGIVNIPNQAYINAAHKNGVKAIACVYFDPNFRPGQTKQEMFDKDKNGKYIIADKLIELANYYGIDGYFLNDEEAGADEFKGLMAQISAAGLWTQFYDINSSFDANKSQYLKDGSYSKIHDSVFVNYGWTGVDSFLAHAQEIGVDPYEAVFLGIEANQGKFENHDLTKVYDSYDQNKNPKASIALFTPSDMYQRGIDDLTPKGEFPAHQRPEYQWMVAERERMYFSGVKSDPTKTGLMPGYSRSEVAVDDASGWVGVADFKAENSVISGKQFFSTFNIGKGVQYFYEGKVANDEAWTNLNDQDILPTWQWWFETDSGSALKADFDFGTKELQNNTQGNWRTIPYQQIGAWHGGSSLVVYGNLEQNKSNFLHLYKTDLQVVPSSKAKIRFKKTSPDHAEMKLGVIFKDNPQETVQLDIENSAAKGDWAEAVVDLSAYANREIAAFGFVFVSNTDVSNYQMNIGQIQFTDKEEKDSAPTGFYIQKIFTDGQMILGWTSKSYDLVDKYRVYSIDNNGNRNFLGGIYDDMLYVKNHFSQGLPMMRLELVAVGKDGMESEAAKLEFPMAQMPKNIRVEETAATRTVARQAKEKGKLSIHWDNGQDNEGYRILVAPLWLENNSPEYKAYLMEVPQNTSELEMMVPEMIEGHEYDLTISPKVNGKYLKGQSYRGRFYDGFAKPLDLDDIIMYPGGKLALRSPKTKDWRYVIVEFTDKETAKTREIFRKERGVDQNFHDPIQLTSVTGTIVAILEDYAGNRAETRIEIDESYKEKLRIMVSLYKPLVMDRKTAKDLYKNENLDEILDRLALKLKEAEKILLSLKDEKARVAELEKEIQAILDSLIKNDNFVSLTFELIYLDGLDKDTMGSTVMVDLYDENKQLVEPKSKNHYVLKRGNYRYVIKDSYKQIIPVDQIVQVNENKVEKVKIYKMPSELVLAEDIHKKEYQRGQMLDLTGGKAKVKYENPVREVILPLTDEVFQVKSYDPNKLGKQDVVVKGFGLELRLEIKVIPAAEEAPEMNDLARAVEETKDILKTDQYIHATEKLKNRVDKDLAEAERILSYSGSTGEQIRFIIKRLQNSVKQLDGERKAPPKVMTSASPAALMMFLENLTDNDPETPAYSEQNQEIGQELMFSFSKEVELQELMLQYVEFLRGEGYIRNADVEVKENGQWVKVGTISGEDDQTVDLDMKKSDAVRILITENADEPMQIGEIAFRFIAPNEELPPQPPIDEAEKEELSQTVIAAKELMEQARYYNETEEKKSAFNYALSYAEDILADEEATRLQVEEATTELKKQMNSLMGKATNKAALTEAVENAKQIRLGDIWNKLSEEEKNVLNIEVAEAEALLSKENAMQKEVDEKNQTLNQQIQRLKEKYEEKPKPQPQPQPQSPSSPYIPQEHTKPKVEQKPNMEVKERVGQKMGDKKVREIKELSVKMDEPKDKELLQKLTEQTVTAQEFVRKFSQKGLKQVAQGIGKVFREEQPDHWYADELGVIHLLGLVKGYEDGTFGATREVTGQEYLTMLVRAMGAEIAETDKDWFAPYYQVAVKKGLLEGISLDLSKPLTRQEIAVLSYNFAMLDMQTQTLPKQDSSYKDRHEISEKYRKQVDYLFEVGVLKGYEDHTYRPQEHVRRHEAIVILYRALKGTK